MLIDETAKAISEWFDKVVFGRLTDDELQVALLEEGLIEDLDELGRDDEAEEIIFNGLS